MTNRRVNLLLFLTILVTTALPLTAAFYFMQGALQTSLELGFNQDVVRVLDDATQNLKTLRTTDPQNQQRYRRQFQDVEELRLIYSQPQLVKDNILRSLTIYFGIGLAGAVVLSSLLAALLSRRIARSYKVAFDELMAQRERVRYLEEISSWQSMAKMLAHEIKNPLTPIEVLVTSLAKSYRARSEVEFQEQLARTESMIVEELGHLKRTVSKFSEFARLPSVQLAECEVPELIERHVKAIAPTVDAAEIAVAASDRTLRARVDSTLFRQVLANIVRNGVEANRSAKVRFTIDIAADASQIHIHIANDGAAVPAELAPRIFDPYVSGKPEKDNMGLGLAIVRKIVIEHGGEIAYAERAGHPDFVITLPRVLP